MLPGSESKLDSGGVLDRRLDGVGAEQTSSARGCSARWQQLFAVILICQNSPHVSILLARKTTGHCHVVLRVY